MTKIELHRLAGAIATLRPDWAPQSLQTFLERNLANRAYRDVALALAYVAVDPDTATPARVLEPGPWWSAAATRDVPTARNICLTHPLSAIRTDPHTGEQTCAGCHADQLAADEQLPLRRVGTPPAPDTRAAIVAAITTARPAQPRQRTQPPSVEAMTAARAELERRRADAPAVVATSTRSTEGGRDE
jgi:acyl-CoA synthetase (NDP forming)